MTCTHSWTVKTAIPDYCLNYRRSRYLETTPNQHPLNRVFITNPQYLYIRWVPNIIRAMLLHPLELAQNIPSPNQACANYPVHYSDVSKTIPHCSLQAHHPHHHLKLQATRTHLCFVLNHSHQPHINQTPSRSYALNPEQYQLARCPLHVANSTFYLLDGYCCATRIRKSLLQDSCYCCQIFHIHQAATIALSCPKQLDQSPYYYYASSRISRQLAA